MSSFQIIRAEGDNWDDASLGCYVSSNNQLVDVITPINTQQENKIDLLPDAVIRLILKTMGDSGEYLGSVSVPAQILPSQGYVWLPLTKAMDSDLIDQIPTRIDPPRVLLALTSEEPKFLQQEQLQPFERNDQKFNWLINQSGFQDRLSSSVRFREESYDIQKFRLQFKQQQTIQQNLTRHLSLQQEQLMAESQRRAEAQQKLAQAQIELEKVKEENNLRELSVFTLLEDKDNKINQLQVEINKSAYENRILNSQKEKLQFRLAHTESRIVVEKELAEQNAILKKKLANFENLNSELQISLQEIGSEWNMCESTHDQEHIENLHTQLSAVQLELKTANQELAQTKKVSATFESENSHLSSQIFQLQQKYINVLGQSQEIPQEFQVHLEKVHDIYKLGGKLIQISFTNNKPYVKIGGGKIPLADYLALSVPELENTPSIFETKEILNYISPKNSHSKHPTELSPEQENLKIQSFKVQTQERIQTRVFRETNRPPFKQSQNF